MKIETIREFLLLTEIKNFTKTAEELYITQPALSRHISAMENEIGAPLILRTSNTFELTPAGKIAHDDLSLILKQYRSMLGKVSDLKGHQGGILRLGALYYDMEGSTGKIRESIIENFPDIQLYLSFYQPDELDEALLTGEVDAILQHCIADYEGNDISKFTFMIVPFSVVYNEEHPVPDSGKGFCEVKDLEGRLLLWPRTHPRLNRTDEKVTKMLQDNKVSVGGIINYSSLEEVPAIIRETDAVYVAPLINSTFFGNGLENRLLDPDLYSSNVSVAWLSANKNPVISFLIDAVRFAYM